jgi:hypothetical protein
VGCLKKPTIDFLAITQSNLDDVFHNVIGAQSLKGSAGLERLAAKRIAQLESLHESIGLVTSEIKRVTAKPQRGEDQTL